MLLGPYSGKLHQLFFKMKLVDNVIMGALELVKYISISILAIAAVGIALFAGWNFFTTPDRTSEYFALRNDLQGKKSDYAKCYNSVNYGKTALDREFKYGMKYIQADESDDDLKLFNRTQEIFMDSINMKCNPVINRYENSYSLAEEIYSTEEARGIWEDYLFNIFPSPSLPNMQEYNPSVVRFQDGFALTNFVFTEEDVDKMYVNAFGYYFTIHSKLVSKYGQPGLLSKNKVSYHYEA